MVPRESFIPEVLENQGLAAVYSDEALLIKRNAMGLPLSSSSHPAIMAEMLELLNLRPGQRVLEIGAGTGYNAALLATIVGPAGLVDSIHIDPEIAGRAKQALREAGFQVGVAVRDGRGGSRGVLRMTGSSSPRAPRRSRGRGTSNSPRGLLVAALGAQERPRATGLTLLGRGPTPLLLIYLLTRIPRGAGTGSDGAAGTASGSSAQPGGPSRLSPCAAPG